MLSTIKKADIKIHSAQIDFSKECLKAINVDVYSDRVEGTLGFVKTYMPFGLGNDATQVKRFDDTLYMTSIDGYLYYNMGVLERFCDLKIAKNFILDYVDYNNQKCLIVVSSSNSIIRYGVENLLLPIKSHSFAYAFGRIFYCYDNKVCFTKPYDYFGEPDGVINIDANFGNLMKVFLLYDDVFIVCNKAILKVPRFSCNADLKVFPVQEFVNATIQDAVYKIENDIYFMDNYDICKFNGDSIERFETCLSSGKYSYNYITFGCSEGQINIPVKSLEDEVNLLYVYDTKTKRERLITYQGKIMSYICSCITEDGRLSFIENGVNADISYLSKNTNLSVDKLKTVYSVCGYVSAPTSITFTGDFGEKTVYFDKGYNEVYCNFKFYDFKMKIASNASDYQIKGLTLKYSTGE